jgi:hypothetical protein
VNVSAIVMVIGVITAGVVVFVALPVLRPPKEPSDPQRETSSHLTVLEWRDRALAALKELEFDHRTGKVSDDDYRALVGQLRREAAEALRIFKAVDPDGAQTGRAATEPLSPQALVAAEKQP